MEQIKGNPGIYLEQSLLVDPTGKDTDQNLIPFIKQGSGGSKHPYQAEEESEDMPGAGGTQSLFNQYTIFSLEKCSQNSAGSYVSYDTKMLFDIDPSDESANFDPYTNTVNESIKDGYSSRRSVTPTAYEIIEWSKEQTADSAVYGPAPYSWSDFLYCKYYGKVPNNHLITLRRYPTPVFDNAKAANGHSLLPIAQAVTFLGEDSGNNLSDIMKLTYGLVWKEIESTVQSVDGNEVGLGSGVESLKMGTKAIGRAGAVINALTPSNSSRWSGLADKEQQWLKTAWTSDGPYWNQVYGPVNVVTKSHMRERGMNFSHPIKLNFHYSLKSIDGVNPKVAMLDLIANMLTLTYNNAKFWGGAMRYFPNYKDKVGFFGDQNKFYKGDWDGYFKSFGDSLRGLGGKLSDMLGKIFSGNMGSLTEVLGQLKDASLDNVLGNLSRQSRPHILSIRNLLSGDPIGEWHITIGNPMNPIAMMGNMIVESTDMTLGNTLGMDDFPTEVSFTISLKHGKPRDKGDIESMFNYGSGKMYLAPWSRLPSEGNTFGDASNKKEGKETKQNQSFFKDRQMAVGYKADDFIKAQGAPKDGKNVINLSVNRFSDTRTRVTQQWGASYGDSVNLAWLFGRTKIKF